METRSAGTALSEETDDCCFRFRFANRDEVNIHLCDKGMFVLCHALVWLTCLVDTKLQSYTDSLKPKEASAV